MENTRIAKEGEPMCSTCSGFNPQKDKCLSVDSELITTYAHHTCRFHSSLTQKRLERAAKLMNENSTYGKFGQIKK